MPKHSRRPAPPEKIACFNRAVTLTAARQPQAAIECYAKAIQLDPYYPEALNNLGILLHSQGSLDAARLCYARALAARPDYTDAEYNYATAESDSGNYQAALLHFSRVLERNPGRADAWNNLGNVFLALRRPADALNAFQLALAICPDLPNAAWNTSIALLTIGCLPQGWAGFASSRHQHLPHWDGRPLNGEHLLIHAEQGLGDTIQFVRYCSQVSGGYITLECHSQLIALFQPSVPVQNIVAFGSPVCDIGYQIPLMSLPGLFKTSLESIPKAVPYVSADPKLVELWRTRMSAPVHSRKVGLVWAGNSNHRNDKNRSIDPALLKPLAHLDNVSFYCLQQKPQSAAASLQFAGVFDELTFPDTAAIIENLDLVISVDTATAHLAGALGRPVWTLLPYAPDWRWMLDRTDSPWYPSMRLFRQPRLGDWPSVIDQVACELRAFVHKQIV